MGASSSAINPTQDFLPRMGGGRLFEVGASAIKYGNNVVDHNSNTYRMTMQPLCIIDTKVWRFEETLLIHIK